MICRRLFNCIVLHVVYTEENNPKVYWKQENLVRQWDPKLTYRNQQTNQRNNPNYNVNKKGEISKKNFFKCQG